MSNLLQGGTEEGARALFQTLPVAFVGGEAFGRAERFAVVVVAAHAELAATLATALQDSTRERRTFACSASCSQSGVQ